jgi:hypothetical protein
MLRQDPDAVKVRVFSHVRRSTVARLASDIRFWGAAVATAPASTRIRRESGGRAGRPAFCDARRPLMPEPSACG